MTDAVATAVTKPWQPLLALGATSAFGLALPAANPTRGQVYAPRGVLLVENPVGGPALVAADTGNHRLLVWPDVLAGDLDSAWVIGQSDPTSEGPQAGGRGPERGLQLPTGLAVVDGAPDGDLLVVADGWNHRVLGFHWPVVADDPEPVWLLGQDRFGSVEPNRGGDPAADSFYWPFGVTWHDGWLWVSDTGNRRVLGWQGLPDGRRPADVVLGQPDPVSRDENRGSEPAADSFRWPHQIAVDSDGVFWVADAGNHRVLGWPAPPLADAPADRILGQEDLSSTREQPHIAQGPSRLRFPYALAPLPGGGLAVADTANNRVLLWDHPPGPADAVLGQDDFAKAGENRWQSITPDSLCWPYGLSATATHLAVADSGNNRITLWQAVEGTISR